jgi:hypothetical protein
MVRLAGRRPGSPADDAWHEDLKAAQIRRIAPAEDGASVDAIIFLCHHLRLRRLLGAANLPAALLSVERGGVIVACFCLLICGK